MHFTSRVPGTSTLGILLLTIASVLGQSGSADGEDDLAKYFALILDAGPSKLDWSVKRRMLASFETASYTEKTPPLSLNANQLRSDAAFLGMGRVAVSTEIPGILAKDARRLLGTLNDPRASIVLRRIADFDVPDTFRTEAVDALAVQMAAGSLVAAEHIGELASNKEGPTQVAAIRKISEFRRPTFPVTALFSLRRANSSVVKNAVEEALVFRKALDDRFGEIDLLAIASIKESRDKLFDDAVSEKEREIAEYQKTLRENKSGKKLVVPGFFDILVMGRLPENPELALKQAQQAIKTYRREANWLASLPPREYAVELLAAYCELTHVRANLDKQLVQVAQGTKRFEDFADFALPLTHSVQYYERDYGGNLHTTEHEEIDLGSIAVRQMMSAAINSAQEQANANRVAVAKYGKLLQADLKRLSPHAMKEIKLAYIGKLAGRPHSVTATSDSASSHATSVEPPATDSAITKRPATTGLDKPAKSTPANYGVEATDAKQESPLKNGEFLDGLVAWNCDGDVADFRISNGWGISTYGSTKKEATRGRVSQSFRVPDDAIQVRFELRGGRGKQIFVALRSDGAEQKRATGRNNNTPHVVEWDIRQLRGKTVELEIVDHSNGPWQFIGVNKIKIVRDF